ncbi:hypothetical protein Syun_012377 [Stephania yunnanensis]|uniref:Uncharacterized protein n=1 Tax=Stephania yunnanensis TaxID=152371 RepID=A0AAP0JZF7_9MAGN
MTIEEHRHGERLAGQRDLHNSSPDGLKARPPHYRHHWALLLVLQTHFVDPKHQDLRHRTVAKKIRTTTIAVAAADIDRESKPISSLPHAKIIAATPSLKSRRHHRCRSVRHPRWQVAALKDACPIDREARHYRRSCSSAPVPPSLDPLPPLPPSLVPPLLVTSGSAKPRPLVPQSLVASSCTSHRCSDHAPPSPAAWSPSRSSPAACWARLRRYIASRPFSFTAIAAVAPLALLD